MDEADPAGVGTPGRRGGIAGAGGPSPRGECNGLGVATSPILLCGGGGGGGLFTPPLTSLVAEVVREAGGGTGGVPPLYKLVEDAEECRSAKLCTEELREDVAEAAFAFRSATDDQRERVSRVLREGTKREAMYRSAC
jgi:hypothetical protein